MGIYYYAVDASHKEYFSAPDEYGIESPSIYHPENPFPHMVVMMNCRGYFFDILNDCSNDIPSDSDYEDVTNKVYKMYLDEFKDHFQPERSKREERESVCGALNIVVTQ